jgi:hypothetical protein
VKKSLVKIALFAVVIFVLTGCTQNHQSVAKNIDKVDMNRAAWLAYWDLDAGEKDLVQLGKKVGKLSYFGAYFDEFDRLFIPSELGEIKNVHKRRKSHAETYLSFVNDKKMLSGAIVLKDIEVLRRIFSNEGLLNKHIDDIIALTSQGDFDGIEIDYERIWKDEGIGKQFVSFADKLYKRAKDKNLKLRIVLEPNTPFSAVSFTKGPEYVVMFYNLFGIHSGPGPKANKEFIEKLLVKMDGLPGEKAAAFSTGGCLWGSDGKKQWITEQEAMKLATTHKVVPQRDPASQSLFFEYESSGVRNQVWFVDIDGLIYWSSLAKAKGIDRINIWRLGGNHDIDKIK